LEQWGEEEGKETTLLKKINSMEDLVGNEENGHLVPDPNQTMVNVPNDSSDAHKKSIKEEVMQEITEKLMEKILDVVNQNAQDALKKGQDNTNKDH
jgi:cell division ATPase FtsA